MPWAIVAVALVVGTVVLVIVGMTLRHHGTSGGPTASSGRTPTATAAGQAQAAERQAATRLDALLAQSVTDRSAVIGAVSGVRACGRSLHQDERTLATAARSRRRLLTQLKNMPGRSALPAALLADLTSAWQASAQSDSDLARWAADMSTGKCTTRRSTKDAHLLASYGPDGEATAGKQAFAALWNPLANRFGLTTYQWEQL
jgi:hypothetical protein